MREQQRTVGAARLGLANPNALVAGWLNGGGGTPIIHESFNVSSFTQNAAGDYTITWQQPIASDGGYALATCARLDNNTLSGTLSTVGAPTPTSVRLLSADANQSQFDAQLVHVIAWAKR